MSIIFFEFSLKVEWLYHSKNKENQKPRLSGFKLISIENNQMIEFYSQNEKDLSSIYKILNSFINIVGFHENYKALKKIGKGSFASV